MTIEHHTTFASIANAWDALAERVDAPPFLRAGWFGAWWQAFGRGSLEIVALRRDGRVVALLPLCRRLGVLRSLGNWHQPEFGILAEDDEARAGLVAELLDTARLPISLRLLDAGGADVEVFDAAAPAAPGRMCSRVQERAPYLDIDGDFEAYLLRLSGTVRADLRRRRRRLSERATVTMRLEDRWECLDAALADVFALEGSGWKTEAGTAIASHPATARFYSEIAHWAAANGWLRLAFLDVDGRPVACEFMLAHRGVVYGLKAGYDAGYRQFSPGRLLGHDVLERYFALGMRRMDYLGGAANAKQIWTHTARELAALEFFPRSTAGAVGVASYRYGRPMAKRTRAYVSRLRH